MSNKQLVGRWGEQIAAEYLTAKGWKVVDCNVRTLYGELDVIAQDGEVLVFVEVKTRTSRAFGLPEEAVTKLKKKHILESAQAFLQSHPEFDGDWRIDVIAVEGRPGTLDPQIDWFEDAIH